MIEHEALERIEVRCNHPQQVIAVAGHEVALHDFRPGDDLLLEPLKRIVDLLFE